MIFITHDLGVIARIAERVVVMYAGRVAEKAPVGALFARRTSLYLRAAGLHPGHRG